jgi:hypothetical protein
MSWSRSLDPLRPWQTNLELSLETGQAPVLDLGAYGSPLDNAPVMVAFHAFANQRQDLVAPLAVCGGYSLMWLIALMHSRQSSALGLSPEMRVIYGGTDLATHVASLSLYGAQQLPADYDAQRALPSFLASFFAPSMQAGPVQWAALPFIEAADSIVTGPMDPAATSQARKWLTWIAVLVSVGLVLLAMIV